MKLDEGYVKQLAESLLNIDSPTGFTQQAIAFLEDEATKLGYKTQRNQKGNLMVLVEGATRSFARGVGAHVDTLGLMVRSIDASGNLLLTTLGGPIIPTLDSEYVRVHTRDGKVYSGTVVSKSPATHVYPDANSLPRTIDNMMVRLDEVVKSKDDVLALGIQHGDIVAIDPKVTITESGFIKSRFLDDKISVCALFGVLAALKKNKVTLPYDTFFIVSTFEEVGHGSSHIPARIKEFLAVDMGCIGLDLACTEFDVSICAKDSSGPYDYEMINRLIGLAKTNRVPYVLDVYPMYGSDASAALRGGNDIKAALIGPGVFASHGLERTHMQAVLGTMQLVLAYLTSEQ
ncbi:MAG: M42 family metallopeptidase [Erysipelotrichaceae bacterium]